MTRILAFDTSTEMCSVALLHEGQVTAHHQLLPQQHAQQLLPMIDNILKTAKISLMQLDAIAFGCGPGSFTGIRIGISVAQGLAFGCNKPLIPVSTLEIVAQSAHRQSGAMHVLSAIDARMGQVYWGQYSKQSDGNWRLEGQECVCYPDNIFLIKGERSLDWFRAGTGWSAYPDMLKGVPLYDSGCSLPQAEDILPLAQHRFRQGKLKSAMEVEPTYLRNEVTWKKLPGR